MSAWACRCAFRAYKRPKARACDGRSLLRCNMVVPGSKWWQAPDDADLDYGFDSDELDDRFVEPNRNIRRPNSPRDTPEAEEGRGVLGNMSSWFQRQAGSHSSQLATTAVLSGAAVAGAIFGYQAYRRKEAVHDLKASIPEIDEQHRTERVRFKNTCRKQWDIELTCRAEAHIIRSCRSQGPAEQRR